IDFDLIIDVGGVVPGKESDSLRSQIGREVLRQNAGEVRIERLSPSVDRRQFEPVGSDARYNLLAVEVSRQFDRAQTDQSLRRRRGGNTDRVAMDRRQDKKFGFVAPRRKASRQRNRAER